jgi:hypothetical protein
MLHRPTLRGRLGKWAYALIGYDLVFESLKTMKGQVVADFILEHRVDVEHEESFFRYKFYFLHFMEALF